MSKKRSRTRKGARPASSNGPAKSVGTAADSPPDEATARATAVPGKTKGGIKGGSNAKPPAKASAREASRRRRRLLIGLGAVPVLAFGGVALHRHDVETRTRHDLSVLGEGTPVVVQVHDPSCPSCRRLMGAALAALEPRDDILYRVADLTTTEGAELGARYGVGKVTLLLFDARGRHVDTVQGVTPADELTARFDERFGTPDAAAPPS